MPARTPADCPRAPPAPLASWSCQPPLQTRGRPKSLATCAIGESDSLKTLAHVLAELLEIRLGHDVRPSSATSRRHRSDVIYLCSSPPGQSQAPRSRGNVLREATDLDRRTTDDPLIGDPFRRSRYAFFWVPHQDPCPSAQCLTSRSRSINVARDSRQLSQCRLIARLRNRPRAAAS